MPTLKFKGKAAQAVFDALTKPIDADDRLRRAARRLQEANEELHAAEVEHRLASEAVFDREVKS